MSAASRNSSPDPIVLPSSPPSAHNARRTKRSESYGKFISPSKSIIINGPAERGQSPWRIRLTVEPQPETAEPSPRAKRRLARQQRRQLAGLDVNTGRPVYADSESPRKRRRLRSRSQDYDDAAAYDVQDDKVPLQEMSAAHYRPLDFNQNIDPQLLAAEAQVYRPSPERRPISPSNDGSDGSIGYEDVEPAPMAPPGAFPTGDSTMANEDFTMITGASLASIKANNSLMLAHDEDDESDKSPPRSSLYPDVTRLTPRAMQASKEVQRSIAGRDKSVLKDYDAMSWQPTGRAQQAKQYHAAVNSTSPASSGQPDGQTQRVQQQAPKLPTPASRRQDTLPKTQPARPVPQLKSPQMLDVDDIWAEEASRSLQDDAQQIHEEVHGSEFVPPIFSDEPQPPRRSKIPSTWRKSSGVNLSYSDSPQTLRDPVPREPPISSQRNRRRSESARDDLEQKTLTPPHSDDEVEEDVQEEDLTQEAQSNDNEEEYEEDVDDEDQEEILEQPASGEHEESDLTNPDAAATQLQEVNRARQTAQNLTSPESASSLHDQADEDSGVLWHENRPPWFSIPPKRPPRPKSSVKVNLSEILRVDDTEVADRAPQGVANDIRGQNVASRAIPQQRPRTTGANRSSSVVDPISSPLARSMLRTNRLLDSRLQQLSEPRHDRPPLHAPDTHNTTHATRQQEISIEEDESSSRSASEELPPDHEGLAEDLEDVDESEEDEEPSQSYQEHLNRHSPGKMRIDFNDSSLIKPKVDLFSHPKPTVPLFDRDPNAMVRRAAQNRHEVREERHAKTQASEQPSRPANPVAPGLLSRLTTSLWSAVVRPSGPIYIDPKLDDSSQLSFQEDEDPVFPSALRARLRSRYGVLADHHPWTMTHMRTLHRMLNSLIAAKPDSIVPTKLPLPPSLSRKVGKLQESATGMQFLFKYQHACAINAFQQVIVPVSLVRAMERGEVEWLGDDIAKSYRGLFGDRWGSELCFKTISTPEGAIDREWLVECIGCVVYANQETDGGQPGVRS